jgi:small GTP-binding protein
MTIWNRVQSILQSWRYPEQKRAALTGTEADQQLLQANQHLRDLLEDTSIPATVRAELSSEFDEIEDISRKLRDEEIHIAAFGRVGVGKSSLLNALLQKKEFSTSPLHGETREEARASWHSLKDGHLILIDTPGIDELDGAGREQLAREISRRADIILMICDGDLTETEFNALRDLCEAGRTVMLVLNKSDRYIDSELELLLRSLRDRCTSFLAPQRIIGAAAEPRPDIVIRTAENGAETEYKRPREAAVADLKAKLWDLLEKKGKSLAALNATIFASELDEKVATRIVEARRSVAEKIIRNYCIGKGLVVAINPVPVADLLAAAGTDIAMVIHLGEVYGFRLSKREASKLLITISAQLLALMGAYWGMNLVSSALKTASAGLSTALTAAAQGALAWYATYVTGKMAESWFSKGKSWGSAGPADTARWILESLNRDSLIRTARSDIAQRLGRSTLDKSGD